MDPFEFVRLLNVKMENRQEVLFSHKALFKKLEGNLVLNRSHLQFVGGSTTYFAFAWLDITQDKYNSADEPIPIIRLSIINMEKPVLIKLIPDAVSGTATGDDELDRVGLREKLEAAKAIIKDQMKRAALLVQSVTNAQRRQANPRLLEKMNILKLEVLVANPVLRQRYQDCVKVADESGSNILTDDEFWGSTDSAGADDSNIGVKTAYGYAALQARVEKEGDDGLRVMWEQDTAAHRAALAAAAAEEAELLPARPASLLSDDCAVVNPITHEVDYNFTPEVIEHIFQMYPKAKAAFDARVPVECSEKEFWFKFVKSQYYTRDKGEYYVRDKNGFTVRGGSSIINQDDFFGAAQGGEEGAAPAYAVRTRRVAVRDPSIDLTATAEEPCPSVFLAINPGGEVKTELEYNEFRRGSAAQDADEADRSSSAGAQGHGAASSRRGSAAARATSVLSIMRKYNRNSALVLTEQARAHGSPRQSGEQEAEACLSMPAELDQQLRSFEDDTLVEHPQPGLIELHMNPGLAPAHAAEDAAQADKKRRRAEGTGMGPRSTRSAGLVARKSNMRTLGSVHPSLDRSLLFLRTEQQLALSNPATARAGGLSADRGARPGLAAEASDLSTLRRVAGLSASTSMFLVDPSSNKDSTPNAAAQAALDAANIRPDCGTVVELVDLPGLSLEFKQQAMLTYLQVTELLRHFYSLIQEVARQQARLPCKTPADTPAFDKLGKIDRRLREISVRQTSVRNELKASPASAGLGWQARLDILQDIVELIERATDIWSKYAERCQYHAIVGTKEFTIDANQFIREIDQ